MSFSLRLFVALALGAVGILPGFAQSSTWTEFPNIQYGELHKGNLDASVDQVSLDVYVPDGLAPDERLPLVIMFHGGGWRRGDKADTTVVENKVPFFIGKGCVFASANYELSPAIKYPVHVQDVAKAIAYLYEHAADYHIDPENISIMGHSAGAQLVALVAVDDQFLKDAGQSTDIISKVVLLDGIYDLPFRLRTDDRNNQQAIYGAFTSNPIILRLASPVFQVKKSPRNYTPPMLNMFSDIRSKIESDVAFVEKLRANGIAAGGILCRKFTHAEMDTLVGKAGSPMNQPILDFLSGVDPQTLDGEIFKPGTE